MSILVIGSVALDSVKTPFGERKNILGGSATYFSIAASFFNKVNMIATVGADFPSRHIALFKNRSIGVDGLQVVQGRTFRWKGAYDYDLNTAHTIYTHLNVFKDFVPEVPRRLKSSDFLFLANIDPELQLNVLKQMNRPRLVACDSMNYWIEHRRRQFEQVLGKADIILLNDAEARQFTGRSNLFAAAKDIAGRGPKAVVIKKGEHGVICFSRKAHFIAPAYLIENVSDPTGAGDSFAGGMVGYLSRARRIDESAIRKAVIYGSILASFTVEDFGVNALLKISFNDIKKRYDHFGRITKF